jgi:hypothetical protein
MDPDTLPEAAGRGPGPPTGGAGEPQPTSTPLENVPTRVPAGTAEGAADPAITEEPDHETQEDEEREPVET